MKRFLLCALLSIAVTYSYAADTLRHYNPAMGDIAAPASHKMYIARFEPVAPGFIEKLVVTLGGNTASGTVKLQLFGHDGGTAFPQWQEDLITPITLNKTTTGVERIVVNLPSPVWVDNDQFFVALSDLASGVFAIASNEAPYADCKSSNGGDYYYEYFHNPGAGSPWVLGNRKTLKIDAIMNYPDKVSGNYFVDVTLAAGLPDSVGNKNIAWADFDKDAHLDLLLGKRLLHNNQDGTFTDVSDSAGIKSAKYTMFVDVDNDSWVDILSLGDSAHNIVYLNNQDGTFTDSPFTVPFPTFGPLKAISIADINKDKYPDFFAARLWTNYGQNDSAFLFINNRSAAFDDSTHLLFPTGVNGNCRGSIWVDYDNDGDLDLYVVNYVTQQNPPRDRFFRNNGDGTFTDIIGQTPLDNNNSNGNPFFNMSSGVDFADYDNDGDMDVLLPALSHPHFMKPNDTRPTTIYRNDGAPGFAFTDMRATHNIQYEETHAGSTWGDVNNDGLLDIITTAFYGCRYIDLYIQQQDHSYKLETFKYGLNEITTGEDAVWVDYNNDGFLDLACGKNNKFALYKSFVPGGTNWVEFDLACTTGNSQGIGARVYVYTPNETYMREVTAGKGQMMQHPARVHVGLAYEKTIDSVVVRWPDSNNTRTTYTGLNTKKIYRLNQDGSTDLLSAKDIIKTNQPIKVHPNPASTVVYFEIPTSNHKEVTIEVYDMQGKKVALVCNKSNNRAIKWDVDCSLSSGAYIYRCSMGDEYYSGTLLISK